MSSSDSGDNAIKFLSWAPRLIEVGRIVQPGNRATGCREYELERFLQNVFSPAWSMIMRATVLDALSRINGTLPAIDDGTVRLSYLDVQRSVTAERRWLQSWGVRRCALFAENSARWILSDIALLACEAVNVPIPLSFTRQQIEHVLDDASITWVLTDRAESFVHNHPEFTYIESSQRTGMALLQRDRQPRARPWVEDLSKVTYTAGSIGAPTGVWLRHDAIQTLTQSLVTATAELGIRTHLCLLPLATLLQNIGGVYVPLTLGARVIVRPCYTMGVNYAGWNVSLLLRAIDTASPESLILVPELLRVLVHAIRAGWRAPASLRFIAVGGGAVSTELLHQLREVGPPVFHAYALSECARWCVSTHPRPGRELADDSRHREVMDLMSAAR